MLRTSSEEGEKTMRPRFLFDYCQLRICLILCMVFSSTIPGLAQDQLTLYPQAAVAADHPAASAAGVEILRQGGNVIDAAVATAFALSVVRPESSGLGGGGFLLHWDAVSKKSVAWDYRERAPLAATSRMYVDAVARGEVEPSVHGILAAAVPGQIPGLCHIHEQQGRLPLKTVLAPALRLASEGVPRDAFAVSTHIALVKRFADRPALQQKFTGLWTGYLESGKSVSIGDRFFSPQKAALQMLSEQGPSAYTDGPIGRALLKFSRDHGGLLEPADLTKMQPVARKPLRGNFSDYQFLTMPPPSSGGIAIIETLNILAAWERRPGQRVWKDLPVAERAHVLAEAWKHAFADRATFLGDADFSDVPIERLTSETYAETLAERIQLDRLLELSDYGRAQIPDDSGTTHFCVMDAEGNAVACTETINTTYGSYMVEPTTGIVLNNEMDDFTAIPGEANAFGLQQSSANLIEPRKKPLSSMSPTIVLQDGRAVAIAGASGGPRIISATMQVLLHMLVDDWSARRSVAAPRIHHQWRPNEILIERNQSELEAALAAKGHQLRRVSGLAATQAIRRHPNGIEPASDPRKSGQPAGY